MCASVGCVCARDGPGACSPARAPTYTPTYYHARLHLVFEPRTKGGAWWRVTTASGVMRGGLKAVFADPRCRTVRNGCKPLHAHSSCLGTTASGQHWGVPITVPVGEPTPPVPAHLRTSVRIASAEVAFAPFVGLVAVLRLIDYYKLVR